MRRTAGHNATRGRAGLLLVDSVSLHVRGGGRRRHVMCGGDCAQESYPPRVSGACVGGAAPPAAAARLPLARPRFRYDHERRGGPATDGRASARAPRRANPRTSRRRLLCDLRIAVSPQGRERDVAGATTFVGFVRLLLELFGRNFVSHVPVSVEGPPTTCLRLYYPPNKT